MEKKKVKKHLYNSIIGQKIKKTKFFLIKSQLKEKVEEPQNVSQIKISKAQAKYTKNLSDLLENNLNCSTTIQGFKEKEALIKNFKRKTESKSFVSWMRLKNFFFRLPQDKPKFYLLTTKDIELKLSSIYFHTLKVFLLPNNLKSKTLSSKK